MFASERAADFYAVADDFGGGLHGSLELAFVARIVKNDGMKIAVAGMENVADVKAVARADFADAAKGLWKFCAGDDAVKNIIAGGETAESAEGVFAAFPEELALSVVAGEADFARVMQVANLGDGNRLGGNGFRESFDFEEKNGGAVAREAGMNEVFDDAQGPAVEHFASSGSDGAGGDIYNGFRSVVHGIKNGEKSFDGFSLAGKLDGDFRDESKGTFGADEQACQIVAWRVTLGAANTHNLAVGENEFEGSDVIGGDAVSERVGAAGVFGDVATDGAGFLAGRIGREVEAMRLGGEREIVIHDARLDDGPLIFRFDRKNAIHPREDEHQTAGAGERPTGEAGSGAAANDGHIVFASEFDDLGDFLRRGWENDYFGASFFNGAVVFVEENLFRLK